MSIFCNRLRLILTAASFLVPSTGAARAEIYELDKLHTQILFFVDHFGFSKSQGEFLDFEGRFTFDRNNIEKSEVEITIYTDSIDMDDDKWNRKMRGKTYFNTKAHPNISFRSNRIESVDDKNISVYGNLTILGSTRPIKLEMRLNKTGLNLATGKKTAGFSGSAVLHRSDFGMTSHTKYIGDEVEIRLEVEGAVEPVRKNDS